MNKRTWIGALALMLAFAAVLAGCGGKSVEQLTKESQKLEEELAQLDPSNAKDAAKMAKLAAETLKLAAELEKAEAKAAGKPAKAASGGGGGVKLTEKDFKYDMTKDGSGVKLLEYIGDKGGKLVIPDTIEGQPVVAIGDIDGYNSNSGAFYFYGFNENTAEGIEELKKRGSDNAKFVNQDKKRTNRITAITIPDTVTFIGTYAFSGCEGLKQINLPKSLKAINWEAFRNSGLTSITIPAGIIVETRAFGGCKSLTTLTLGENVELREDVFEECAELTTVNLPSKIRYMERDIPSGKWVAQKEAEWSGAFHNCPKLSLAARKAITDSGYKGSF
jgi:hypothetical protein